MLLLCSGPPSLSSSRPLSPPRFLSRFPASLSRPPTVLALSAPLFSSSRPPIPRLLSPLVSQNALQYNRLYWNGSFKSKSACVCVRARVRVHFYVISLVPLNVCFFNCCVCVCAMAIETRQSCLVSVVLWYETVFYVSALLMLTHAYIKKNTHIFIFISFSFCYVPAK